MRHWLAVGVMLAGVATAAAPVRAQQDDDAYLDLAEGEVIEMGGEAPEPETSAVSVDADEAAGVAGAAGDPIKAVASLPGVARSGAGSAEVIVWGAAPGESAVYIDGVEVPALYHLGGHRSILAAPMVRAIELAPGAYGAEYGRSVGGVVDVSTRDLPGQGVHGALAVDAIDSSLWLTGAFAPRARAGLGARVGYLDRLLDDVVDQEARELVPLPRYYDAQAKAELYTDEGSLAIVALAAGDRVDRRIVAEDPAATLEESVGRDFARIYLRYETSGDGATHTVTPFVGFDRNRHTAAFGAAPAELASDGVTYGVRARSEHELGAALDLDLGFDALGARTRVSRYGTLALPAREGDVTVFGQPPGDDVNADEWIAHTVDAAPYAVLAWRRGAVRVTAGGRLAAVLLSASRKTPQISDIPPLGTTALHWLPEPRASVVWEASRTLAVRADVGVHHQAPAATDLSPVFGAPELGPLRARHAALGAHVSAVARTTVQTVAYYKTLHDLPTRSADPMPFVAEALVQSGRGRAYGAQMLVRQAPWRGLSGWLAYTLSRSERRDDGATRYRLLDYDQTHVLTAVASYRRGAWSFGSRLQWATGMPRTPVIGAYYDAKADRYQPVFGDRSGMRLPNFVQLDLRVEHTRRVGRYTVRASLDLQNVTNRANPEEVVYDYDYSDRAYLTGLPALAVLGLGVEM